VGLGKSSLTQLNKNSPIFSADIIAILRENQGKFTYFSESHYKKEYLAEHPWVKISVDTPGYCPPHFAISANKYNFREELK